ncbi:hypothetical protein SEA_MORRILL_51 [Microbacterium phage Morrill]|nr:hypothetical protein SEA_ATRAXI_51 [Microbacterium phage Atraxi]UQT01736.1 hypothetical protein SEA_MORRILL_51 [Microbacterium phage Morrill]
MRFTRRTYRAAIRRSYDLEFYFFRGHMGSFCGPEKWQNQMRVTNRLMDRRKRELGRSY